MTACFRLILGAALLATGAMGIVTMLEMPAYASSGNCEDNGCSNGGGEDRNCGCGDCECKELSGNQSYECACNEVGERTCECQWQLK
jgi:hypothetical protein